MSSLRVWWSRALELVLGRSRDRRLSDEIQAHVDQLTDDHIARGLPPAEARLAARKDFGGVEQVKETYRDRRGLPSINGLVQDVRFAARLIVKDRWFTAAVVTALSMGLAVSTMLITVVYGMNLRPLPFVQPQALMAIGGEPTSTQGRNIPYAVFDTWRSASRSFTAMAAHLDAVANIGDEAHQTDQFVATFISHDGFALLGKQPMLGRAFRPDDDRTGAPAVVILGHGIWSTWYGSSPSAIGRIVRINGEPATVVGVMPEGFKFPTWSDVWRPLAALPAMNTPAAAERPVRIVARLADGFTTEQARAELASISAALPAMTEGNRPRGITILGLNESIVGRPPPLMLVAVAVILLITCSHAANLLLARSAARTREMSLRAAIGASRARIVRQLLVESTMLAAAAGLAGLGLASFGVRWFAAETAGFGLPFWTTFELDFRLFALIAAMTLGTGILFGLLPALQLARTDLGELTNQAGRQGGTGPRERRTTAVLLVGELAVTVMLLACAGLLIRSASVVYRADHAIDVANLWEFRLSLPQPQYASEERRVDLYRRLDERLAAAAGLQSAALASAPPFTGGDSRGVVMDERPSAPGETRRTTRLIAIGDRYFETLGLRLLRGTGFEALDAGALGTAALVNERFAAVFSPDRDVIGRQVRLVNERAPGSPPASFIVTGITPAIRQDQNGDVSPVVYLPHRTQAAAAASILIRGNPDTFAEALRQEVRAIDPDLPLYGLRSLVRVSEISRWYPRISSLMFTIVGSIALVLSALGLYALTAYAVSHRTQEIGIRMAVGARASQVLWLFIRGALVQLAIGLSIGLAGAIGAGLVLRGLLIQTSATDPLTMASVCALLTVVALAASLIPARGATRLDPLAALRRE